MICYILHRDRDTVAVWVEEELEEEEEEDRQLWEASDSVEELGEESQQ